MCEQPLYKQTKNSGDNSKHPPPHKKKMKSCPTNSSININRKHPLGNSVNKRHKLDKSKP